MNRFNDVATKYISNYLYWLKGYNYLRMIKKLLRLRTSWLNVMWLLLTEKQATLEGYDQYL